jgi:hypothetical protein
VDSVTVDLKKILQGSVYYWVEEMSIAVGVVRRGTYYRG